MATTHNIHRPACTKSGRSSWWIRDQRQGEFVDIGYPSATLDLSVSLHPGHYLIGVGKAGGYRDEVWITADGTQASTRETGAQMAPCIAHGCTGVIAYDAATPPPSCDADGRDPPRARKCGGCQGVY